MKAPNKDENQSSFVVSAKFLYDLIMKIGGFDLGPHDKKQVKLISRVIDIDDSVLH